MGKARIYIGTSGWVYKSWHEKFYPPDVKKNFLAFYSQHFNTVEINTSFYHLPKKSTFQKWHGETPDDFAFAVKLSRYITHIKKLEGSKTAITQFLSEASALKKKLAVVLIQIPPSLAFDEKIFSAFLKDLNAITKKKKMKIRYAMEMRHPSWFEGDFPKVREIIKRNNMSLVLAQSSIFPFFDPDDEENVTSDFVYVRFHGPEEFAGSGYGRKVLRPWAQRIARWHSQGKTVFAYFNNDMKGHAVRDADALVELVRQESGNLRL